MDEEQANDRDLRIDVSMDDDGRRYRVTHIASNVSAESEVLTEAMDSVNKGLEGGA